MDQVEEIKDRLGVEEVVGSYVQLKPAGRNLKGVCPFHQEKTPSFMVSPDKGIWHCFGCQEGGDIFTFVQKMEGVEFREALEKLAAQAGVTLVQRGGKAKKTERLYEILKLSTSYFQQQLVKDRDAQEYLVKQRGFNKDSIANFKIGFAPARPQLVPALLKRGYEEDELIAAGVARRSNRGLQDLFFNRIMIPFADTSGRTIGFTGRVLNDALPKYLNTPQTVLFDKSRYIFGLFQAKEAIRSASEAVVVEGNLDVITAHQYGYKNVVAVSGTALTEQQLKTLARFSKQVKLAFDPDSAGLRASERAIPLAQKTGITLHIASLPENMDPDELIKANPDLWVKSISQAPYVLDWLIEALKAQYDLKTAIGKREFSERMAEVLNRLTDSVEQDHYVQRLAGILQVNTDSIWRKVRRPEAMPVPKAAYQAPAHHADESESVQEAFLALNLVFEDTRISLQDVSPQQFASESRTRIVEFLKSHQDHNFNKGLPEDLQDISSYVKILLLRGEEQYGAWAPLDRRIESFTLAQRLLILHTKKTKQQLTEAIREAEGRGDAARVAELLVQYRDL